MTCHSPYGRTPPPARRGHIAGLPSAASQDRDPPSLVEDLVRRAVVHRPSTWRTCSAVTCRKSVPLGKHSRTRSLACSFRPALPGMARGREAEPRLQPGGDLPASGELLAVVRGHGMHPVPVRTQAPRPFWPAAPEAAGSAVEPADPIHGPRL